jgi:hypothetical protein
MDLIALTDLLPRGPVALEAADPSGLGLGHVHQQMEGQEQHHQEGGHKAGNRHWFKGLVTGSRGARPVVD